jgi:hypothetical protein
MRPPLHMPLAAMTMAGRALLRQHAHHAQVRVVVGNGGHLLEGQRVAARRQLAPRLGIPVPLQLRIAGGEIRRQR